MGPRGTQWTARAALILMGLSTLVSTWFVHVYTASRWWPLVQHHHTRLALVIGDFLLYLGVAVGLLITVVTLGIQAGWIDWSAD